VWEREIFQIRGIIKVTEESNHDTLAKQANQLLSQGVEFYYQHNLPAALNAWQQAIELRKQLPLDNPEYRDGLAWAYYNCGVALSDLRRWEEAITHYQQAIELRKQLPLANPEYRDALAWAYNNCGVALRDLRRFEEAITYFQQAIELRSLASYIGCLNIECAKKCCMKSLVRC
jgi:tetratricopeptide (TPR) repeat protein